MKKQILFFVLATALVSLFVSCETDADVDVPEVPSRLVLNCFISPQDTLINVRITKSAPIFQQGAVDVDAPVTDATVRITGNSTVVQLNYDSQLERYTVPVASFPILAGNEYSIEVSAPGMETVTAKTTVPSAVPADYNVSMSYTLDTTFPYQWDYVIDLHESFTDFAQSGDLYRMSTRILAYRGSDQDTISLMLGEALLSDNGFNGSLYSNPQTLQFQAPSPQMSGDSVMAVVSSLVRCSKEYYYFHLSLQNNNGGGDPFSEPTLMYTNVEKGYGVFAGCNYKAVRMNF